jgi:FMN-dependent dehydrogenase
MIGETATVAQQTKAAPTTRRHGACYCRGAKTLQIELSACCLILEPPICEDWRADVVQRAIFEYGDRGSYDDLTITRNRTDLQSLQFRERVMRDLSQLSLASELLGQSVTMPLAIAPTGLAGLFYGDGEILGCRAAQAFGIPFFLSTMSICSIEDVRKAVAGPCWFQVYLMRDRSFNQELIARARGPQVNSPETRNRECAHNSLSCVNHAVWPVQELRSTDNRNIYTSAFAK